MIRIVTIIMSLGFLAACSDGGGGNSPNFTPYNDGTRAKISQAFVDQNRTSMAIEKQMQRESISNQQSEMGTLAFASNNNAVDDDFLRDVDGAGCDFELIEEEPLQNDSQEIPRFEFRTIGADCPMSLNMVVDGAQISEEHMKATVDMSYVMNTEEMQQKARFLDGRMNMDIEQRAGQSTNGKIRMWTKVDMRSSGTHIEHGAIEVNQSMEMEVIMPFIDNIGIGDEGRVGTLNRQNPIDGIGGLFDINMKGKDRMDVRIGDSVFVRFESSTDVNFAKLQDNSTWRINGKAVSQEEYQRAVEDLEIPGVDLETGEGNESDSDHGQWPPNDPFDPGEPQPQLFCAVTIFEGSQYTRDEIFNAAERNELYLLESLGGGTVMSGAGPVDIDIDDMVWYTIAVNSIPNQLSSVVYRRNDLRYPVTMPFFQEEMSNMVHPVEEHLSHVSCN